MAPWRGTGGVLEADDFFLILGAAIESHKNEHTCRVPGSERIFQQQCYFLNKLSKAARASFALRGAGIDPFSEILATGPEGKASRATVTRGENSSQEFA